MADVKVRIIGEDKLSGVLRGIDANLGKAGSSVKGFFGQLGNQSYNAISGTMGKLRDYGVQMKEIGRMAAEAALPIAAVGGAVIGVGAALKKSADEYMNYANQVSDLMDVIGGTPEEVSKLIQVADDVRISFDTMKTAMIGAVRKGVDPSIAGLMQLSDAYNKLPEGAQRAKFLLDSFGRSGAEMARLMELGGDAIAELGKKFEGTALEINENDIKSAEDYYAAIDDAGDAWEKLKLELGKRVAPVVVQITYKVTEFLEDTGEREKVYKELQRAIEMGAVEKNSDWYWSILRVTEMTDGATDAMYMLNASWEQFYNSLGLTDDVVKSIADGMDMVGSAGEDAANRGADAWDNYKQALADAAGKEYWENLWNGIEKTDTTLTDLGDTADETGKKLDAMFNFKIPDISGDIKGMLGGMKWDAIGGKEFEAAFRENMTRLYNWAPEGSLAMDTFAARAEAAFSVLQVKMGELSTEDAINQIAEALGLTVDEAKALFEWLMKLDGKQFEAWFTLHQNTTGTNPTNVPGTYNPGTGSYTGGNGQTYTWDAGGGPAYEGRGYVVGEQGPELFFPRSNGDIISNNQAAGMFGGTTTNQFYITTQPGMSETTVAYKVLDLMSKRAQNAQMAGIGYAGR